MRCLDSSVAQWLSGQVRVPNALDVFHDESEKLPLTFHFPRRPWRHCFTAATSRDIPTCGRTPGRPPPPPSSSILRPLGRSQWGQCKEALLEPVNQGASDLPLPLFERGRGERKKRNGMPLNSSFMLAAGSSRFPPAPCGKTLLLHPGRPNRIFLGGAVCHAQLQREPLVPGSQGPWQPPQSVARFMLVVRWSSAGGFFNLSPARPPRVPAEPAPFR